MLAYIVRRLLYAIPILIGVNLITFALFFVVNSPDDMARMQLGVKRVTPEAIEKWKVERGYDLPLFWNGAAAGLGKATQTIFYGKSVRMFAFDFGRADDGRDIGREIVTRMGPSLAVAVPVFVLGLFATVSFALLLVYFRASYLDTAGVILEIYDMQPHDTNSVVSAATNVRFALETPQGWFQRHNISPGAVVRTERGSLAETFLRSQ